MIVCNRVRTNVFKTNGTKHKNPKMKSWLIFLTFELAVCLATINAQVEDSYESLRNDFINPPQNARPKA